MTAALLPNSVVLAGGNPEAQTISSLFPRITVRMGTSTEGVHIFTTSPQDPAVVLKPEHAAPYSPLLKAADFQAIHKGTATPESKANVMRAYAGMDEETFLRTMRTVGCGTNIYIQCADGLHQLVVQRSPASRTPEGVVQAGAFSRAAGGCTGDIQYDQVRETIEEPHIFIRGADGKITSIDPFRADKPIARKLENAFFAGKAAGLLEVFPQVADKVGTGATPVIETKRVAAHALNVPGLTETVVQIFADATPKAFRSVVVDDAKNGDVSGVDAIVLINLPHVHSRDIFVADGERGFDGKPLGRPWMLLPPATLEAAKADGSMKFSPAPGKVIENTAKVVSAISTLNL